MLLAEHYTVTEFMHQETTEGIQDF